MAYSKNVKAAIEKYGTRVLKYFNVVTERKVRTKADRPRNITGRQWKIMRHKAQCRTKITGPRGGRYAKRLLASITKVKAAKA